MAAVGCVGLLLAGCAPVPGAGWAPESTAAPSDGLVADASPEILACAGPLEGPLRIVTDAAIGAALDTERTALETAGLGLLHITPAQTRTLTLGGRSGAEPICASRVVAASADDLQLRTLAAAWAALDGVPLVLTAADEQRDGSDQDGLVARLVEIDVSEVAHLGAPPTWLAVSAFTSVELQGTADVLEPVLALAGVLADRSAEPSIVLVLADDVTAQADLVADVRSGGIPLVLPTDDAAAAALIAALTELGPPHTVRWAASSLVHARALTTVLAAAAVEDRPSRWQAPDRREGPPDERDAGAELWLGDVRDPVAALQAAVAAATRGGNFVAVDGAELRSGAARTERMRMLIPPTTGSDTDAADSGRTVVLVGALEEHTRWQLATVLTGTPLPTGGFLPLEEQRIVALYGSPGATGLGLLGQQDDAATIALAREYAAGYEDAVDGRTVVPGLDIIATVASSSPGPLGDYSRRVPLGRLRTLVDLAREEGVAVLIDLQPGRTDFLTQAQELEGLLREPHVHLALDPEWRIGAQERHLVRIGSVSAAEVQAVADWLAQLVRDERLPQKILMIHQFTLGMFPDRDTIAIPRELIGVIHMDGQGSLAAKERTYSVIVAGTDEHWEWGWKNFTRIDRPLATPERTLARDPIPVIITYQ
jgi:hypothetical protein